MPTRTVKAKVELDGEKQYKQALSELNKGNQVLASEMRKLQAEYKGNTESTEFLTKKGQLLEQQLLQQRDKVETLREAMAKAAQEYGESSAKTQEWQIKLNNAEAAQYDLEHAIQENNQALQKQDAQMQGMGDTVSGLASKFGVQLPKGATDALNSMKGFSTGTVAALSAAAAAVAALYKGIQALSKLTLEAAHDVDKLITESMTTGLSTETIQKFKYAENLIDVSYSTITSTLSKLTRSIADAAGGNKTLMESFSALGVSVTDANGELRSSEEVFYDLIDALGTVENSTERDALAMSLMGKSAQELNPLILRGSEALREMGEEAENTGYILDESQIAKLGEVDDAYQQLQLQLEATRKQLASEFAPASKDVMEAFSRLVKSAGDALTKSGIIKGVAELVQFTTALLEPVGALIGLGPELAENLKPVYTVVHAIAGVFAWLADVGNAAVGVFQAIAGVFNGTSRQGLQRFNTALGQNAQYGMYSNLQRWNGTADVWDARLSGYRGNGGADMSGYGYDAETGRYYDIGTGNYIYDYNATGNDNWRGGMTWVGEAGPELVYLPKGSQILNTQDSRAMGGDVFNITIDAHTVREFNDIIRMARDAQVMARMEG